MLSHAPGAMRCCALLYIQVELGKALASQVRGAIAIARDSDAGSVPEGQFNASTTALMKKYLSHQQV